jgi:hypothetical protein
LFECPAEAGDFRDWAGRERGDHFSHEFTSTGRRGAVDVAELLIALPGEGDFLGGVPKGEFGIEPDGLFVGEVFSSDLQGPADPVERVALAAAVSEGVLLDAAPDLVDRGRPEFDDVESIQDGDRFGELITDRVRVAVERVQGGGLDPGGELGAAGFEPVRVGQSA